MGFGLLALGYIFLTFYTTGADLVGYIIMLIALLKLSKIEKSFKKSIIAIIILIPVGIFNLFGFVDTAFKLGILRDHNYQIPIVSTDTFESMENSESQDELSEDSSNNLEVSESVSKNDDDTTENEARKKRVKILDAIFNALFIFGSLSFHYFFYQSMRSLCIKTQATKLGFKAYRNMAINIVFFSVWGFLTAGGANMAALNIITALHFVIIVFNFIYIFSSYATFAYENSDGDEKDE